MNTRHTEIILRPIISEKTTALAGLGKYAFEVAKDANKIEIAQAVGQLIKELYPKNKSQVVAVNTAPMRGRIRRSKRHGSKPRDSKKAIVTISGEPLDLFSA
jgi:large subunit ribosomal protein L23